MPGEGEKRSEEDVCETGAEEEFGHLSGQKKPSAGYGMSRVPSEERDGKARLEEQLLGLNVQETRDGKPAAIRVGGGTKGESLLSHWRVAAAGLGRTRFGGKSWIKGTCFCKQQTMGKGSWVLDLFRGNIGGKEGVSSKKKKTQ